uniref:RRM domain-containing protein n=1 Tax=viral metagenome TaxID=1070528 RepID=A0A6C0KCX4_9ZZZZ
MYTLCLPKIDNNVSKKLLFDIFNKYNFGIIYKIDLITIKQSKRAFIHYNSWNNNEKNEKIKNYLDDGLDIKIIYEFPWFWKCSKSKS